MQVQAEQIHDGGGIEVSVETSKKQITEPHF